MKRFGFRSLETLDNQSFTAWENTLWEVDNGRQRRIGAAYHEQRHSCQPPNLQPSTHGNRGFDSLAELALDMRWSWNHATDEVWRKLDPKLWEITHNPWVVLQTVSRDQIERCWPIPFSGKTSMVWSKPAGKRRRRPRGFRRTIRRRSLTCAAYFSMEFMLSEALPIYSGGLGNVAGDQLKAASDLGVPVVGVGLLYQQGYFRQVIDKDGAQASPLPV